MQKPLETYLEDADGAGKILAHARLLLKLSGLYPKIAPPHLAEASTLANYKSGTIVIHAANVAVASKLRQLAPTLADGFARKGVDCSGIQVKVQARNSEAQSGPATVKPLSSRTSTQLEALRDSLPAGELRAALAALLENSARAE